MTTISKKRAFRILFFLAAASGIVFFLFRISYVGKRIAVSESMIQLAERGDAMVKNGFGNLKTTYIRVDSLSARTQKMDEQFLERPAYMEIVIFNSSSNDIFFVFNKNEFRGFLTTYAPVPPYKDTVQINNKNSIRSFDPRFYGMSILGNPVSKFLRKQKLSIPLNNLGVLTRQIIEKSDEQEKSLDFSVVSINDGELVDGWDCSAVHCCNMENNVSLTVWLAAGLFYRPVKTVIEAGGYSLEIDSIFRQHENGVWFSDTAERKEYYTNEKSGEKILYSIQTQEIDHDFEINTSADDPGLNDVSEEYRRMVLDVLK